MNCPLCRKKGIKSVLKVRGGTYTPDPDQLYRERVLYCPSPGCPFVVKTFEKPIAGSRFHDMRIIPASKNL